ncbi:MAG: hypothetical protein K8T25_22480, partial [Planctomycetia bacterium]|nr:hypothetical protein [Planctomycetia bacterium]
MATGTTQQLESMPDAMRPSDDLIEEHIARTRGYVAACDVAGSLVTLFAFGLGYLLLMAVADHWLFFGGMGGWGRAVAWLVLVLAGCGYAAWTLVPFCLRKISPLYAAAALEKAQPTLKNSLVNFILLKGHRAGTADAVFRGLSLQTAAGLVDLPVEAAVDRRRLLRASYVLIGLLVLAAGYLVISPKNPLTAAARVLVPWADIAASTRVRIEKIQPGDGDAYRGEPLTVSAEVRGLRDREPVTLHFSTVDGQVEDQTVVMYPKEGELVYSCQLPPESGGMQRDLVYTIRAGDARSRPFHIRVIPAPVIQIAKIEYRYPEYTRMPPQVVERLGDIKAIEGTSVVIHAQASQPIQTASIELSGARSQARSMETRGELAARVALPLRLVRNRSGFEPEFNSYRLRVTNERGDRNRDTVSYRIEVTPDLGPQVEILAPQERELKLPADGELPIEVRGRDADFELSDLRVQAKCGDRKVCDEPLLDRKRDPLPWNKTYRLEMRFRPAKYQLKPGDVVQLRAIALDNKTPQPNRAETGEYRIVITEPENPPGEKGEKGENGAKGEKGDAQGDKSDKGMKGGKNDKGEKGDKGQNDKSGKGEDQKGDGDSKDSKSEKDSKGEKGSKGGKGQGGSGSKKDSKDQKGKSDSGEGGSGGESGDDKADQKSDPKQGDKSKGGKGSSGGKSGEKGDKSDGKSDGKSDDMSDGKSDDMSGGDSSSGGKTGSKGSRGSKSGQSKGDDQLAQRDQEPSEPAQSDGDAVQDILDHRKEKEGKTPQDNAGDKQPAGEKPSQ